MRVAIVGASGNVGTALLRRFADDPTITSVVALARRPPPAAVVEAGDLPWPYDAARWLACDLAADEPDEVVVERLAQAISGADAVVHLAWARQPGRDRATRRRTNVLGTRRVTDAVVRAGVPHLIVASAAAPYSPAPDEVARTEDWPTDGVRSSTFSLDKVAVERILDDVERLHPDVTVARVRPVWVAQRAAGHQIATAFLGPLGPSARLARGFGLPWPRGLRVQAVDADDLAEAFREIVVRRQEGAFNVAAPDRASRDDIAAVVGRDQPREISPSLVRGALAVAWHARLGPADPSWLDLVGSVPAVDTARARRLLGWSARLSSAQALGALMGGMLDGSGTASPPLRPARGTAPG
ncbi:MAG: NAD-dependent epimerase/dehydratase family protein [Cellulomonas sp.]